MRVALFGSPSFALPALEMLHQEHELLLVVSQPDKPAGRGNKLSSPAAALWAKAHGVKLGQPTKLKNNAGFRELLTSLNLDVAVTAAYGKILPQALLGIPKHGFLNIHGSLLPHYRGAAPVQWALINGDRVTGVSIMQTTQGLDSGPVRLQRELPLTEALDALAVFEKLAVLGAEALAEALTLLAAGRLPSVPQQEADVTFAPLLKKEDGRIRWQEKARSIYNRYRGVRMWPGSFSSFAGKSLKVLEMTPLDVTAPGNYKPGSITAIGSEGVSVQCGESSILLKAVQPAGKSKMGARDWANGYGVRVTDCFDAVAERGGHG